MAISAHWHSMSPSTPCRPPLRCQRHQCSKSTTLGALPWRAWRPQHHLGTIDQMQLEVLTPLGEYAYYTVTLETAASQQTTQWHITRPAGSEEQFAMPGSYSYFILAYDGAGNEREVGPFTLEIGAPPSPLLNAPYFVTTTTDLWAGFAPGASLYMVTYIDDADLGLGNELTVTHAVTANVAHLNRA